MLRRCSPCNCKRLSEHLEWNVPLGSTVQALCPSLCHTQTLCFSSLLWEPLTRTLCSEFLSCRLFHSYIQRLLSCSHSLATIHPPTLSSTSFASGFHADTSPLYPVSHNNPFSPTHRHPPSPEHMQSRGISFYCANSLCNHTHLSFIHCSNTFGVEVALLRAATQSVQESQLFTPHCHYS